MMIKFSQPQLLFQRTPAQSNVEVHLPHFKLLIVVIDQNIVYLQMANVSFKPNWCSSPPIEI